ncbi:MAG TPA: hypothetical protein VN520_14220 [Streptomyces sp.]|uniref:hypothetical protein n=1 Tax=Streptomyces sp. TaxID=1931 RepID=UPI002C434568|nr:hypothetical protein [Streptomyces sp.]HWU07513.1 hypothetical protein [Streptomyces sp.]
MSVTVTQTNGTTTIDWKADTDDKQGHLAQAISLGRLDAALTALGLSTYTDIATLDEFERAEILRGTAALVNDLTRRVRHLTVACREGGMTWGTLASNLTGDPNARSTARSTYEAGVRQLGTRALTTYEWHADNLSDSRDTPDTVGYCQMSGTVTAVSEDAARKDVTNRLTKRNWVINQPLRITPLHSHDED